MSIYAIQVQDRKEEKVKDIIMKLMNTEGLDLIKNIYAFGSYIQYVGERSITKLKSVFPGYIFIEIDCSLNDIWYFLKQVPFVRRILPNDIQQNEFKHFFEVISEEIVSKEEPDVQLAVHEMNEDIVHQSNISKTPQEKSYWLDLLRLDGALLLKKYQQMKKNLRKSMWAKRIRGFTNKEGKPTFIVPYSLLEQVRQQVDPDKKVPIKQLANSIIYQIISRFKN